MLVNFAALVAAILAWCATGGLVAAAVYGGLKLTTN